MIGTNNAARRYGRRDRPGNHGDRRGAAEPAPEGEGPAAGRLPATVEKPERDGPGAAQAVNAKIARLDDGSHVQFLDIGKSFLNRDGTIPSEIMPDFLHLSREGLPDLGRRHGAHPLADARRAPMNRRRWATAH